MPLIVFEGTDGSGKSTQTELLRGWFAEQGVETEYIHFPRFGTPVYGDMIARFLRGELGDIEAVNPYIVALLFAGDRADAGAQLHAWLAEGRTVLLDRYVYSNIAFQCAKFDTSEQRNELKEWILHTEFEVFAIPRPDLSIWLDVPLEVTQMRLAKERQGDDRDYLNGGRDIHEASMEFQRRVRETYLQLAISQPDIAHIDCSDGNSTMLSAERIAEKVRKSIKMRL